MRIGVRWTAGQDPHDSVPEQLRNAIREVDQDGQSLSWTLTWLEGLPVCTRSDGTVVTVSPHQTVTVKYPETSTAASNADEDDDDDWLLE